jgi:transglutaminase-like putative cysteine protease
VFFALTGILSAEETRYGQTLPARFFEFTYRTEVSRIPPGAREVQVWVPVAKSNGYQKIHERKIQSDHPYRLLNESEYDNEVLYVKLDRAVPERVVLQVDYGVSVNGHEGGVKHFEPAVEESFLKSERLMVVNETVRRIAQQVTHGKKSNREKARALYRYVLEHMTYDKSGTGWGRGDTIRACAVGTGNCTDFHSLFVSLARASGIPSRFHMGASIPKEEGQKISGYHCWADFYSEEGWVPVDIS